MSTDRDRAELDRVQDAILAADTTKELVEIAIGYAGLLGAELGHQFTVATALVMRAAEIDAASLEAALAQHGDRP